MNHSGKRLVVFGAGYVGSEVARQAVARGLHVTALTRNPDQARVLAMAGIETVVADLADCGWHRHIAGAPDLILNSVSSGGSGIAGYRHSYVEGMRSMLAWAMRSESNDAGGKTAPLAGTMVYTSSTSVYPQGDGVLVDESAPVAGNSATSHVLVETENMFLAASGMSGRRAFVLRLAGIYGPGRHHLLDQLRAGVTAFPGHGNLRLNLINRDDICAAIWAAFAAPPQIAGGAFNVADDGAARKAEVMAWLATRVGQPPPQFTGEPAPNGHRAAAPDRVIANEKLKRVLGWRPLYPTYREGYTAILST